MVLGLIAIASCLSTVVISSARIWRAYLYGNGQLRARRRREGEEDPAEAIIALGGCIFRELEAVQLVQLRPRSIHLYISSGELPDAHEAFGGLGDRVTIDRKAVDTLTNFTSLYHPLVASGVRSVTVVTSKYHMPRAAAIARFVLGDAGIGIKQHVVADSNFPPAPEPYWRVARDVLRAWIWILTGWDGRGIALYVHPYRKPDLLDDAESGRTRA
jgi:uncharacterized SAM-binding protein YcdF (DUF218 family)